jgi:hypothetical protein
VISGIFDDPSLCGVRRKIFAADPGATAGIVALIPARSSTASQKMF